MTNPTRRLGLVHTAPVLGALFHDLVLANASAAQLAPEPVHVTDPWMLQTAMSDGVTSAVLERLTSHVEYLARQGSAAILVTCSSLGEATEQLAARRGASPTLIRIDEAMADRAVELAGDGGRVAVLATVQSTAGPTERLIQRSAERAGVAVHIDVDVLEEAGKARARGDQDHHDTLINNALARWTPGHHTDVVVLAQATMAHLANPSQKVSGVPVLSSPALAVERLIDAAS